MTVKWLAGKKFGHVQGGLYNGRLVRLEYQDRTIINPPGYAVDIAILMDDGWNHIERIHYREGEKVDKEVPLEKARALLDTLLL
jgi:hypothetical protein